MTPEWLLTRYGHRGQSGALFELKNRGVRRALGHFRWHHAAALRPLPAGRRAPIDGARLLAGCRRREALGYLRGLARGLRHLRSLRDAAPVPAGRAAFALGR